MKEVKKKTQFRAGFVNLVLNNKQNKKKELNERNRKKTSFFFTLHMYADLKNIYFVSHG
jgi:hypothetical protein